MLGANLRVVDTSAFPCDNEDDGFYNISKHVRVALWLAFSLSCEFFKVNSLALSLVPPSIECVV